MRELESSLQSFGEYLLKAEIVRPNAAPYSVRWVRRFLSRPASNEPLVDQVRQFCEDLERRGGIEDWQVRQADQALRVYFVNLLKRTDWQQRPNAGVDQPDTTNPLTALDLLRTRLRTRHYSYRTECIYVDWVRCWRMLERWALRVLVPVPFATSIPASRHAPHEQLRRPLGLSDGQDLEWLFAQRKRAEQEPGVALDARAQEAAERYRGPRFDALEKAWRPHGNDAVATVYSSGVADHFERGQASVEFVVMTRQYLHLAHLVGVS